MQRRIEFRIGPYLLQFSGPNSICVSGLADVDGRADGRNFSGLRVRLAIAGPGYVVNLLKGLSALSPSFDDLDSVKISIVRIFYCPNHEGGSFGTLGCRKITAHRSSFRICGVNPILISQQLVIKVPTAKHSYLDAYAARAEYLFPFHRIEDRLARILLCPYPTEAGSAGHHCHHA